MWEMPLCLDPLPRERLGHERSREETMAIKDLGDGIRLIDLEFQGQPGVIAAYLIEDAGERALIETGPTSTLDTLIAGLHKIGVAPESIAKLLVTHIHLDHAGAAGTFLRRFPQAHLFVHEVGAPHMLDPAKLWTSAGRIYGDMLEPLWGSIEPVPAEKLTSIGDEFAIAVGNRTLTALYTPGHASHHVVYHDPARRIVFAGDVAAARLQGANFIRPPTPPPDLDLELWSRSIDRVLGLDPRSIMLTHFGPFTDVQWHMEEARKRLYTWGETIRKAQASGQGRPEIVDNLIIHADREMREYHVSADALPGYELATPYGMSVDGYLRYFRKQAEREAAKA